MDSITEFSRKCQENKVKFDKRMVRFSFVWVAFNLSVTFYDLTTLYYPHNYLGGIGVGGMIIATLLSILSLIDSYQELTADKSLLKYLNELHEKQLASGERQQYLSAKEAYEQMIATLENDIRNSTQEK